MRLEREEATRLLEEETEVRNSSSAGPQATVQSVKNRGSLTNTTALQPQDFTMSLYPQPLRENVVFICGFPNYEPESGFVFRTQRHKHVFRC